ncbi:MULTISPECIES: hypothetical protein [Tenacibaculum]|uniref:hypothetical protein n=1 Tax=Tenacibaculum TaxID=104267 RepID=UPI001E52E165|nr:hypothetical protein [Tenacibaculum finnmarkense]MCD8418419.1 hypothetical protein [Tenacibaculum finnmarkense genomovar finnmarkense]MCG8186741.1 hypothetical protein [Tenacibaculum finnmarkense genomovar finnmarkense]MCG8203224.1 hypothetical protein [Tenacibaculum finnmarkense genomovar finnmarkense]MCG8210649.1 hypothetical protein [Tenacibaculum finnmarkense genomovar finnmarkense]MCG8220934.1 hypothetical protein [Tenacibaculum finnmarkense genomovar finnmarkense]
MKKILVTTLFLTITIISCGKKQKEEVKEQKEEVKFESINNSKFKIGNRDKKYFKMVDGDTEIKIDDSDRIEIVADFEIIKTFKKKLGVGTAEQAFVSLIALDDNGKPIKLSIVGNGEMRSDDSDGEQFADFLRGEKKSKSKFIFTGQVSKEGTWDADRGKTIEAGKKIKGFKVLTEGLNY